MACNSPDFGKVKPSFSQMKKSQLLFLNLEKALSAQKIRYCKNTGCSAAAERHFGGSLATENRGTDFCIYKYALDTDPDIIAKRQKSKWPL